MTLLNWNCLRWKKKTKRLKPLQRKDKDPRKKVKRESEITRREITFFSISNWSILVPFVRTIFIFFPFNCWFYLFLFIYLYFIRLILHSSSSLKLLHVTCYILLKWQDLRRSYSTLSFVLLLLFYVRTFTPFLNAQFHTYLILCVKFVLNDEYL